MEQCGPVCIIWAPWAVSSWAHARRHLDFSCALSACLCHSSCARHAHDRMLDQHHRRHGRGGGGFVCADGGLQVVLCSCRRRSLNHQRKTSQRTSQRIHQPLGACDICSRLMAVSEGLECQEWAQIQPFELFLPMPSLSMTSSAHCIRRELEGSCSRSALDAALRRRTPDERLNGVEGPGWAVVTVALPWFVFAVDKRCVGAMTKAKQKGEKLSWLRKCKLQSRSSLRGWLG